MTAVKRSTDSEDRKSRARISRFFERNFPCSLRFITFPNSYFYLSLAVIFSESEFIIKRELR
jgi:hypothetical protein